MAVSIASERSEAGRDRAIVFVHGFTGASQNWDPMIGLLRQAPGVRDAYAVEHFAYETRLLNFDADDDVPTVKRVAERLASLLGSTAFQRYRELTLVGHSQGGLVIEQYLVDVVGEPNRLGELERIRQVILFATPNLGSAVLCGVRRLLGYLPFVNRQEKFLRALNDGHRGAPEQAARQGVGRDRPRAELLPDPDLVLLRHRGQDRAEGIGRRAFPELPGPEG